MVKKFPTQDDLDILIVAIGEIRDCKAELYAQEFKEVVE